MYSFVFEPDSGWGFSPALLKHSVLVLTIMYQIGTAKKVILEVTCCASVYDLVRCLTQILHMESVRYGMMNDLNTFSHIPCSI